MSKSHDLQKYIEFKKTSVHYEEKLKDIKRYLTLFINSSKKSLSKFTETEIVSFINSLNFSIRTINDIKSYLKNFIKWNYPDWSSRFRNLDKICKSQMPPKAYTPDQMLSYEDVEKIVKKENNLMWKTFWLTFFYGGFRPSEVAGLKWEQIFFEPEGVIIKLRTGKTKKDFIKSLPKEAEHNLRELKTNSTSEFVFPSPVKKNEPIKARGICTRLKRVSKKALGKEVVPYQLRHSIATILYADDTKKDDVVAQQLGHNESMRENYKHLNIEQIKIKARKLWGSKLTKEEKEEILKLKNTMERFTLILESLVPAVAQKNSNVKFKDNKTGRIMNTDELVEVINQSLEEIKENLKK